MLRKLLLATATFAADLPSNRAPQVFLPPPIPVFTWTGFYAGVQAGYAFGRTTVTETSLTTTPVTVNVGRPDGFIGGLHVGYNVSTQSLPVFGKLVPGFGSGFVLGIEGDVDGVSDHAVSSFGVITESFRNVVQGSARGRLGIAVDRALFYATGGAAFADFQDTFTSGRGFDEFSHTLVGYTVGGGLEYAVANNVSIRAEYRYSDFGNYNSLSFAAFRPNVVNNAERVTIQRVQVGISYKFDNIVPATPVVARY